MNILTGYDMTNEELVLEYQRTENRDILEEICKRNKGLVGLAVKGFRRAYTNEGDFQASVIESDDLMQEGYIGLIYAVKKYDPEKGAFSTLALEYIQSYIIRFLRDKDIAVRVPVHRRTQVNKLRKFREAYYKEYGSQPEIEEISAFLGVSEEIAAKVIKAEIWLNMGSLNAASSIDPEHEREHEIMDTIPDERDPFEEVEAEMCNAKVWALVDTLKEGEAAVIRAHFKEGKSLAEIGENLLDGVTRERTRQIKDKALQSLRCKHRRELADLAQWYDIASSVSYNAVGIGSFNRTHTSATEKAAIMRLERAEKARKRARARDRLSEAGLIEREQDAYFRTVEGADPLPDLD